MNSMNTSKINNTNKNATFHNKNRERYCEALVLSIIIFYEEVILTENSSLQYKYYITM